MTGLILSKIDQYIGKQLHIDNVPLILKCYLLNIDPNYYFKCSPRKLCNKQWYIFCEFALLSIGLRGAIG